MSGESRWRRMVRYAHAAADLLAGALFLCVFAAIVAQTAMRYVFRSPLTTSQEFATLAFVWLIFWAAACSLRVNDHIRFDLLFELLSDQAKRGVVIVCNLIFLAIFAYAAPDMWEYFVFLERQFTASLTLSYQIAFLPFFIFYFLFPFKLALNIASLMRSDWKSQL